MEDNSQGRRAADLMRAAFEAIAARDADAVVASTDDQTYGDFVVLGPIVGTAEIRSLFDELFRGLPDLTFETVRILDVDENTAVGEWRLEGTFSGGPFRGVQPTGRHLKIRGVDIMEFADCVLRRNTIFYDGMSFARQIGLLPAEGSSADRALLSGFNTLTMAKRALNWPPGS